MEKEYIIRIAPSPSSPDAPIHPTHNPSVAACCEAYNARYRVVRSMKAPSYTARSEAADEYKRAMPALYGQENIRNFIACVVFGLLSDVLNPINAQGLLYAAQVASGANRLPPSISRKSV